MKVKEESEKDGLKLNIQKTKIMASGPITLKLLWYMNENLKTLSYFSVDTVREILEFSCKRIYEIRSKLITELITEFVSIKKLKTKI